MDRKRAIEILSDLADTCAGMHVRLNHDDISAIKMGLRSLQVDEKYQLEYEQGE